MVSRVLCFLALISVATASSMEWFALSGSNGNLWTAGGIATPVFCWKGRKGRSDVDKWTINLKSGRLSASKDVKATITPFNSYTQALTSQEKFERFGHDLDYNYLTSTTKDGKDRCYVAEFTLDANLKAPANYRLKLKRNWRFLGLRGYKLSRKFRIEKQDYVNYNGQNCEALKGACARFGQSCARFWRKCFGGNEPEPEGPKIQHANEEAAFRGKLSELKAAELKALENSDI